MKKIFLYGLSIISFGLVLGGCMPDDELTYEGAKLVEFKNHLQGKATVPAGVSTTGQTMIARTVSVNTRVTDTIYVQLVGPQSSTAQAVTFNVESTSTAVAGTHYNFRPVGNRTVNIPANSSVGYLLVDMIPGSVAGTATFPLRVTLVGNGELAPSANYKTFTLTLRN